VQVQEHVDDSVKPEVKELTFTRPLGSLASGSEGASFPPFEGAQSVGSCRGSTSPASQTLCPQNWWTSGVCLTLRTSSNYLDSSAMS
jgi:hypothetical protein